MTVHRPPTKRKRFTPTTMFLRGTFHKASLLSETPHRGIILRVLWRMVRSRLSQSIVDTHASFEMADRASQGLGRSRPYANTLGLIDVFIGHDEVNIYVQYVVA
jgi:hypothetical protein